MEAKQSMLTGLLSLLHSRKFWALIAALASTMTMYNAGQIPGSEAVAATVAALAAYSIGTGIESAGESIAGSK